MSLSSSTCLPECPLCLNFFRDPILLPCGHTFERKCIEELFKRSPQSTNCPNCRRVIDRQLPLVSNYALRSFIQSQSAIELFLIDINLSCEQKLAALFLRRFLNREIFNTRYFIQTMNTRLMINSNQSIDEQISQVKLSSLVSLKDSVEEAIRFVKEQNVANSRLFILTDGSRIHSDVVKISGLRRILIHLGNKSIDRSRQLADNLDCYFNYLDEKNIDTVVQHFSIDQ